MHSKTFCSDISFAWCDEQDFVIYWDKILWINKFPTFQRGIPIQMLYTWHRALELLLPLPNTLNYEEVLKSPYPNQEGNKLQRPNSGFIQHTPHEAQ